MPAIVRKDSAQRTEQDIETVFGDHPTTIAPKGNPAGNAPLPNPHSPHGGSTLVPGSGGAAPAAPAAPAAGSAAAPAAGSAAAPTAPKAGAAAGSATPVVPAAKTPAAPGPAAGSAAK